MSMATKARLPLVVMGVSGSGKTSVGVGLAVRLGLAFVDGDSLHSAANVAKMHAGIALDDSDRAPWLDAVGAVLGDATTYPGGVVVACSALKRGYRDRLRAASGGCRFLYLALAPELARERVGNRPGHFMPASLVANQFATLEPPARDETDITSVDAGLPLATIVAGFA
jgi:gluconokinase